VSYPATWHRATTALTPQLSDPHEILAAGSYPLRPGAPPHCVQYPVNAIDDLRPTDALVWLAERQAGGPFPPRRGLFLRSDLRVTDESPACLGEPKVFFHGITAFEDQGRDFEVYVAWGSDAPAKTRRAALAVLDSLQFDPGPVAAPRPRCGMLSPAGPKYNTVMLLAEANPRGGGRAVGSNVSRRGRQVLPLQAGGLVQHQGPDQPGPERRADRPGADPSPCDRPGNGAVHLQHSPHGAPRRTGALQDHRLCVPRGRLRVVAPSLPDRDVAAC
jgi:hypothetical protein